MQLVPFSVVTLKIIYTYIYIYVVEGTVLMFKSLSDYIYIRNTAKWLEYLFGVLKYLFNNLMTMLVVVCAALNLVGSYN